jgi:hypothetical protein
MEAGDIALVENALQLLIKEWERFFAGVRKTPPQIECERLARRLRLLTEEGAGTIALQFRLEQVQNRFQSFSLMWERMLRDREEGRTRLVAGSRVAPFAPEQPQPAPPNAQPVAIVDEGGDAALFERYVAARRELGQSARVDRTAFAAQLEEQRLKLESRLGCRVRFEVVVDGDKVKLAARKLSGGR